MSLMLFIMHGETLNYIKLLMIWVPRGLNGRTISPHMLYTIRMQYHAMFLFFSVIQKILE